MVVAQQWTQHEHTRTALSTNHYRPRSHYQEHRIRKVQASQASHHGHDTPFMPPPSCPYHSQVPHVGVEEEERVGCASIGSRKSGSIGAVGEVPRSQTREQTPRKLNPTRTITNVERCPIARSAPQRNRDSAPPAQDAAGAPPQDLDAPARQPTPRTG